MFYYAHINVIEKHVFRGSVHLNSILDILKPRMKFNGKYSKSLTSFDELAEDFKSSCKSWGKSFVPSLPHVNASHYIHVVTSRAPQFLVRDHGLNIHNSSGIKRSHQTMKMDISCHSGQLPLSRTLPVHWLMRTDIKIQCSSPIGR